MSTMRTLLPAVSAALMAIATPAHADEQAAAIVEKMMAQKADMIRQASSYIVQENHNIGTTGSLSGTASAPLLYTSVCNPRRLDFMRKRIEDYRKIQFIEGRCLADNPHAYSILRPKEIEYLLDDDQYHTDRALIGMKRITEFLIDGPLRSRPRDGLFDYSGYLSPEASRDLDVSRDFGVEDVIRDIDTALQERADLREFGQVAEVLGEITVAGRPAWALVARDLNRKQVTEEGEFTITGVGLAVDKTRHVQLAMFIDGVSRQDKRGKGQRFWIVRQDKDYRPIEGTTALIPYETVMALNFKLEDAESQRELRAAQADLEQARAQLKEMRSEIARAQEAMGSAQSGLDSLGIGGLFADQMAELEQKVEMLGGMGLDHSTNNRNAALHNLEIKTVTAAQMEEVLNGDGVGDVRKIEFARKGALPEYLEVLQGGSR